MAQHGAEVRDHSAAISCKEDTEGIAVELKSGNKAYTEKAKYVINCEGVAGALKRKLTGIKPKCTTTYQTYNQGQILLRLSTTGTVPIH